MQPGSPSTSGLYISTGNNNEAEKPWAINTKTATVSLCRAVKAIDKVEKLKILSQCFAGLKKEEELGLTFTKLFREMTYFEAI